MKNRRTNNMKFLGVVFLSMLVLFITIASADTEETPAGDTTATDSVSSAGAQAIATGSETIATVEAVVSSDGASSSATAKAKAENGGTATAIAEAWANWVDGSSAYARAVATAVAGAGETIWAEATAQASASSGKSDAYAGACVGDSGCIDRNEDNNGGGDNGGNNNGHVAPLLPKPKLDSIGGFIFGKGDIDRYCTFKLQLLDGNTSNDDRASYFMNVIAWDGYGFTEKTFEQKYGLTNENCTQILSDVTIKVEAKNYDGTKKLQSYYTADSTSEYTAPKGIVSEYSVTESVVSKDAVSKYSAYEYSISGDSIVEDTVYYE